MKYQNVLITLGVAAIAFPLLKALYDWAQAPSAAQSANGSSPQVKRMVEQTLQERRGEASSFVQAFEEALEEEAQHDRALAHAAGRRA